MAKKSSKSDNSKVNAILQYIFPIGLIWWLVDEDIKKDKFSTFHMKEALALVVLAVAVNIVGSIIPIIGWFIILPIGNLLVFILWIIGIYRAAKEEQKHLPISGWLAQKF